MFKDSIRYIESFISLRKDGEIESSSWFICIKIGKILNRDIELKRKEQMWEGKKYNHKEATNGKSIDVIMISL